ncbi:MAG: hypothetical protein IKQ04_03470 [Oscillospiraceae bacterium]|nr:hypothetical protein [Oscillospiraceae bacterium]
MDTVISVMELPLCWLGFAGIFIAPIAWIVFAVTQHRLKKTVTQPQRKHRRILRTASLILAILLTLCVIYLCFALSENPAVPLPETTSISVERFTL